MADPIEEANEAMSRYAQGDAGAFEAVYDGVAPRLAGYLRRRVRDRLRLEDLLQQTFLQMHRARGTFVPGAEVLPWAFAIARRLMIDAGRTSQREEPLALDGYDDDEPASRTPLAAHVPTGEEHLEAREVGARLERAYRKLSEPQRAAFELVKTEGLSHAQAAAVLGTSVTGVKLRVYRAYHALRGALEGTGARPARPADRSPGSGATAVLGLEGGK